MTAPIETFSADLTDDDVAAPDRRQASAPSTTTRAAAGISSPKEMGFWSARRWGRRRSGPHSFRPGQVGAH